MNKILFFVKETQGGTGTFLNQISLLNKNRFKGLFYFYKKDDYFAFKPPYILVNSNYPISEYPTFSKLLIFLSNLLKTYKIVSSQKPNCLFACDLYSFIQLSLVKRMLLNKEICLFYHLNIDVVKIIKNKPNFFYRLFLTFLYKSLCSKTIIIFPSKSLANHLIKRLNLNQKQVRIIPYGIDISAINILANRDIPSVKKWVFDKKYFKIISIGRFCHQKDFATLLKAFSIITNKFKNIKLVLIGDGNLKNELVQLSISLRVEEQVLFLGWKQNVFPYLKYSNIFVFSSLFEGFGITILEAMAMKIPVVATDTLYGPSEILEHGKYGILVPIRDSKVMAEAIEQLICDKKLRKKYSVLGYQRAKKYNLNTMLKKYEGLILNPEYHQ